MQNYRSLIISHTTSDKYESPGKQAHHKNGSSLLREGCHLWKMGPEIASINMNSIATKGNDVIHVPMFIALLMKVLPALTSYESVYLHLLPSELSPAHWAQLARYGSFNHSPPTTPWNDENDSPKFLPWLLLGLSQEELIPPNKTGSVDQMKIWVHWGIWWSS